MLGWFAINPVTVTVSLKESKQKSLAELCHNISSKHKVAICEIEKIVETISSDLIAVPLGVTFKALERFIIKILKENWGSFEKMFAIYNTAKMDLLWLESSIVGSYAAILSPFITLNIDASSYEWGVSTEDFSTGGLFSAQVYYIHITVLKLKAALFVFQTPCKNMHNLIDNICSS